MDNLYDPLSIEAKWQRAWEESGLYAAPDHSEKPKYYCLDYFPYPSGEGLHVGHCRNYVPTDLISRYKRMKGFNVLHPMGWDAFGEPAEQFAVAHGVHPRLTTDQNTANFRRQMTLIGTSYDWSREIDSSRPEFYRWTQWFFLMLYRRGLAYRDTNWQWWCNSCQTTLSSHEVQDGVCWRGHAGVTRREIPAWYFRITAYADELLSGLDDIDWPEPIKAIQRFWIGRSEGVEVRFPVFSSQYSEIGKLNTENVPLVTVFTSRPDTLFGVTYLVLAPEHELAAALTVDVRKRDVEAYRQAAIGRGELDRTLASPEKTGVFTGSYVAHPLSGERLPVWIADYVLPGYGSGAVMGVPAHDERDLEFAMKYGLPVRKVVVPEGDANGAVELAGAFSEPGVLVDSGRFSGLPSEIGGQHITIALQERSLGGPTVIYRVRDWLISRQRYWGTPIPIVYCSECGEQPVPEEQLPVLLPEMTDFSPDGSGQSPLARNPGFVQTTCPECGRPAQRETDTMGGFACSSWYFLRFTSPYWDQGPFDPEAMRYWMPVDLYVGGAEHAVLHLLYARFWIKAMADEGLLPFREPFNRLLNQGQMLGLEGQRMSKSRGNVITPDSVVETHGADALRIYGLFMAPFDQDVSWTEDGISGARRFLNRVWNLFASGAYTGSSVATGRDPDLEVQLHRTIRKVTERIDGFRFNTMVSTLMEFANQLYDKYRSPNGWRTRTFHEALEFLLILLAPSAPHITEELWEQTGHMGSIHQQTWPEWDPDLAREEMVEIPAQIDGKLRAVVEIPSGADEAEVREAVYAHPKVQQYLENRVVIKEIYKEKKIYSILTKQTEGEGRKTDAGV